MHLGDPRHRTFGDLARRLFGADTSADERNLTTDGAPASCEPDGIRFHHMGVPSGICLDPRVAGDDRFTLASPIHNPVRRQTDRHPLTTITVRLTPIRRGLARSFA
ncbi:MAG: hypothetical protein EBT22_10400 [Chloroflexi bacterium]|nr:hypothetical protein [Chloroflexota bacterium]